MAEALLPQVFRKDPPFIVSYDFNDMIQGTGYIFFHGIRFVNSASNSTYHLIEPELDVGLTGSAVDWANPCGVTISPNATYTFDTNEFKISRNLKGIPYALIPSFLYTANTTDSVITISNAKLIKVAVGGGTTNLTSEVDLPTITLSSTGPLYINPTQFIIFSEIAKTTIAKGEKIRLSFDVTGSNGWALLHNPAGTNVLVMGATPASKTQLKLALPFELPV